MKISSISICLFHAFYFFPGVFFKYFPLIGIPLIFCLCHYLWCWRGNNHFDVRFQRIGPVPFLSKDGKDAVPEGRNGWKSVYFPLEEFNSVKTK